MKLLERILVPVDFGPNTDAVIRTGTHLARAFGADVRLLYAIEEIPRFPNALELLSQSAGERLEGLRRQLAEQGIECELPIHSVGNPFDTIVRTADGINAHLIVMGRGRSCEGERSGLGTTAARVLRRSAHPVMTVAPEATGEFRRILCPVDGSSASARGVRNAILLASRLKARLTVMTTIADLAAHPTAARLAPEMAKIASDYERM